MKANRPPRVFASLLLIIGVTLGVLGVRLALLGGSLYYVLSGALLLVSAVLLWRGDKRGSWVYGGLVVITLAWSLVEVGFDAWALAPRLAMFAVLGLWLLAPRTRRKLNSGAAVQPLARLRSTQFSVAILAVLIVIGIWSNQVPDVAFERPTNFTESIAKDWPHYGRNQAGTRYAPFGQINADNVQRLKVAWIHRTGLGGAFKATPLQIADKLFFCSAGNVIFAVDAQTGTEQWRFDPKVNTKTIGFTTSCRGVTYYKSPQPLAQCTERLLTATTDARMFAVDAADGRPCADFGAHENTLGEISLLPGMGEVIPGYYYVTSPPTIARGVAVLGGWVLDNNRVDEPSGVIRAFDPLTGKLRWAWDMGRPGKSGLPEAGATYTPGTPNAWSVFSADDELGLVYIPTGNATPDYFGGHRSEVAEKYASSLVALDAATGEVRWSYQTTHHDIWDYDVPSQPVLTVFPDRRGVDTPAVIVPTKRGELFVFDRRTGVPLIDIEERPVPQGAVPEDWTSKTQPFAVGMPSFGGGLLTEQSTWGITPIDHLLCRIDFRRRRYEGPFTPPSVRGTLEYPGFAGGMNWGSVTVHEDARLLVVQALHMANKVQLTPRDLVTEHTPINLGGPQTGTPYLADSFPWLSPLFVPCQQPPYGEMAVVDLATRRTLWRRPVGTTNELGPVGLKLKIPLPMGVFFSGGTVVTQSGLIFVGGTMDRYLRAIDLYSGKELWRDYLPGQAQATPLSYLSRDGRQFVVVTVPGEGELDLDHGAAAQAAAAQEGGYVIAYALED